MLQTTFDAPWGSDPVTLNLSSMGKGEVWINGESIGRYWVSYKTPNGQPSQSLSVVEIVPQYFLRPGENTLVLIEEMGGDPLQITVNTMSVTRVYSSVNELSTPSLLSRKKHPAVRLRCQQGKHITDIEFASYGNPVEGCRGSGSSCLGSCHAETTEFVIKDVIFSASQEVAANIIMHYPIATTILITKCLFLSGMPWQKEVRYSSTACQVRRRPVNRNRKIPFSCGKLWMSKSKSGISRLML